MRNIDERIQRLAAASDNVVCRPDLLALKMTDRQIRTLLLRRRWQILQRGVYLVGAAPPTRRQRARAAVLAAGPFAALWGASAVAWCRVDGAPEDEPIEDLLLDFAGSADDRRLVERAVESALLSRRTTERRIWRVIAKNARPGVRGVVLLRDVMANRSEG